MMLDMNVMFMTNTMKRHKDPVPSLVGVELMKMAILNSLKNKVNS